MGLSSVSRASAYTDAAAASVWQVAEMPGSVQPAVQKTVAGHTVSIVSSTVVTNTYTYDGFGRQVSATDGRGNTTVTAYNALGPVAYTEDAASNRTAYAYDAFGRQSAVTPPLSNTVFTAYDSLGNVTAQWGGTYPVEYGYDTRGRRISMKTFRVENGNGDETRWLYDNATGLLTNKVYADGSRVVYTYTAAGQLASRVWACGVTTAYSYDALGQLAGIGYSDATPDVVFGYDRLGRVVSAVTAVSSNLFAYSGLAIVGEVQNGVAITRSYDGLGRSAGFSMGTAFIAAYGYDTFGRFASVSSSVASVSSVANYSYVTGSGLVASMTNSAGFWWKRAYEQNRDLIAGVENRFGGNAVSDFAYGNDANGRRESRVDSGSVTNLFANNGRGEVTEAVMGGDTYAYGYDGIGNRFFSALNAATNTYAANNLNQYTAVIPSVAVAYDADGNMTRLGDWYHTWDAENRLAKSEPYGLATNGAVRLNYQYNHRNLQIAKITEQLSGRGAGYPLDPSQPGTWDAVETRRYVWDGYNIAAEIVIAEVTPSTNVTYYTWGLDLSGTLQGAGGVGGLLAETKMTATFTNTCFAVGDANGNVTEYVDAVGTVRGHYEYSPFGEITAQSGDLTDRFTHRFSTKPFDVETGKARYQLRPYDPPFGRWLSRDPIEEVGGLNYYAFVLNNPINAYDPFGLRTAGSKPDGECDKCGPEIATGLTATMNAVKTKFDALPKDAKSQHCSFGHLFGTWDIVFPLPPSGCGKGGCNETVMVHGMCYDKWKVNYILFGRIASLCEFWRLTMEGMIAGQKLIRKPLGDNDWENEYTEDVRGFARIGYKWNGSLPSGLPSSTGGFDTCEKCDAAGADDPKYKSAFSTTWP